MKQIARWTKATKNWEWNSAGYIFIVLFPFSQDYATKAEIIKMFGVTTIYLRKTEIKRTFSSIDKKQTGRGWWPGGELERDVHKVRRLRHETGKAVTGQVRGKFLDTSFLIDRSSLPEPYL